MNANTCWRCAGTLERKTITHQQPWGTELYEFENVPAWVCGRCSEVWLERRIGPTHRQKLNSLSKRLPLSSRAEGDSPIHVDHLAAYSRNNAKRIRLRRRGFEPGSLSPTE
jgi:YgiT-type zinc finger domain-containing protein